MSDRTIKWQQKQRDKKNRKPKKKKKSNPQVSRPLPTPTVHKRVDDSGMARPVAPKATDTFSRPVAPKSTPLPSVQTSIKTQISQAMSESGGFGRPKELTQVATYTNDPAMLTGDMNLSPFNTQLPKDTVRSTSSPNVSNPNVGNLQDPIVNPQQSAATQAMGQFANQMLQGTTPEQQSPETQMKGAAAKPLTPLQPDGSLTKPAQQPVQPQPTQVAPQTQPPAKQESTKPLVQQPQQLVPPGKEVVQPSVKSATQPIGENPKTNPIVPEPPVPTFSQGGFTGDLPKMEPAGIVHGGEFVFSKEATDKLGPGNLQLLHELAKKVPGYATGGKVTSVVAGKAKKGTGQVNIENYSSQIATNPGKFIDGARSLVDTGKDALIQGHEYETGKLTSDAVNPADNGGPAATAQGTAAQAAGATPQDAASYEAATTEDKVANTQATAQQGTVSNQAQIQAEQIDVDGHATGQTALGQALDDYASQDLNEVDPKATLKGQLEILQSEFVDPNTGEPKIPVWAAQTARNVSKIAAFSGMTGSAATAAMAQALMEASLPVAQQDAQFFQTLTIKNLDNKQASIINKANVLANFDMANLDARMTAAVENSKAFLAMDMKNLDNRQQAELINTQNRVQSILEDAKAVNAQRLFTAESQNDMSKFYESLNAQISQFNAAQANSMEQFNVNEANAMTQFNEEQELAREQFYKTMQYNIDVSNANWRREVQTTNAQMRFEAAATDVKNAVGLSTEMLNQIWDRSDALLDYLWKSTENDADRANALKIAKIQAKKSSGGSSGGLGGVLGSVAGTVLNDFLF